jgi:CubicO group peptidase (beta-lactamase class C family)
MTRLAVLLAWLLAVVSSPLSAVAAPPPLGPDFADWDSFVQAQMDASGIPGVALAVVDHGQVVHERGFGTADASGRPVTPQTVFRIGSNSKGFTALAIMQLVEQGRVRLDAPVQRYLPWFHLADADASAQITVEQLLYHTSGIPGSALYDSFIDPNLTLEQYGHDLSSVHTNRPVGASFEYSNANYDLAGLIVEAVSGQSYADYVQQHIFDPLQMTHSTASRQAEIRNGLAQGHAWLFGLGPFPADDPFSQANLPAGFIASTADDLAHYLLAQLNGGRYGSAQILSADGMARMHQAGAGTQHPDGSGYAMGWGVGVRDDTHLADHTGETMRFISRQVMDLDHGRGLIVLTNATNQLPSDDQPFKTLTRGLLERLEGWPAVPPAPSLHTQYGVLDLILVVLSIAIVWSLLRLREWKAPATRGRLALAWLRVLLEVTIPLSVLLQTPALIQPGISWRSVVVFSPDLGWWLLIVSALLLFTGLARGALLIRALRQTAPSHKEARQWLHTQFHLIRRAALRVLGSATVASALVTSLRPVSAMAQSTATPTQPGVSSPRDLDPTLAPIDEPLQAMMAANQVPGVAVGLLVDGQPHTAGWGITYLTTHDPSMQPRCSRSAPRRSRSPVRHWLDWPTRAASTSTPRCAPLCRRSKSRIPT